MSQLNLHELYNVKALIRKTRWINVSNTAMTSLSIKNADMYTVFALRQLFSKKAGSTVSVSAQCGDNCLPVTNLTCCKRWLDLKERHLQTHTAACEQPTARTLLPLPPPTRRGRGGPVVFAPHVYKTATLSVTKVGVTVFTCMCLKKKKHTLSNAKMTHETKQRRNYKTSSLLLDLK